MTFYEVTMQHTEDSFEALAHMQYNLFCTKNRIARTVLCLLAVTAGIINFSQWWGILLVAYGCYLTTSTYSSANHTAHKLSAQIKASGLPFPASRYVFQAEKMQVVSLPEERWTELALPYAKIRRLGEDMNYFYIFRDEAGGYMIPKNALKDESANFRGFLEQKSGLMFQTRSAPVVRFLRLIYARSKKAVP